PDVGHLHGRRHAVDQDDLVAPVELVGLARRVVERHIGFRRHGSPVLRPALGVASYRIVAAVVTETPKLLVNPDQGQLLARRLARVGRQKAFDLSLPDAGLRQWLPFPLIGQVGLIGPQYLADCVARHMQFPDDLLHRPALHMEGSTNTRNRIHSLQLPLHPPAKDGWSDEKAGGSKLDAGYPARGVNIPRRNTLTPSEQLVGLDTVTPGDNGHRRIGFVSLLDDGNLLCRRPTAAALRS